MKWIQSSNTNTSMFEFLLVQQNVVREKLRYDPLQHSARISHKGRQRVFYIEKTGFWNNQTIFQNEYGLEIGRLHSDRWSASSGVLKIEDKRYHYQFDRKNEGTLIIYEHTPSRPALSCSFAGLDQIPDISSKTQQGAPNEFASLLLGLGWYLMAKETADQPALEIA